MWHVAKVAKSGIAGVGEFTPMFRVRFLYPSVASPPCDDVAQGRFATGVVLQGSQVVHCEGWLQLVEYGVVDSISRTLVFG